MDVKFSWSYCQRMALMNTIVCSSGWICLVLYAFPLLSYLVIKLCLFSDFLFGSEDKRLSCGYSSFRGKRVTMEDFYDIKTSNIDGHSVCLFGIFDGKIFQLHHLLGRKILLSSSPGNTKERCCYT